jgi:hypothetical protein
VTRRPGAPGATLEREDGRTLSLASVQLDTSRLRQVLAFERTLRAQAPAGCSAEQTAAAHAAALATSGLRAGEVEAPLALLRRFAANRALARRLRDHLGVLETAAATDPAAVEDQLADVRRRLNELEESLAAREEAATRAVLDAHQAEILSVFAAAIP